MADDDRGQEDVRHLPRESLSPLAARVDRALALYGYELEPAIEAIDAAVPGIGGLFEPTTADDDLRAALDDVIATGPPESSPSARKPPSTESPADLVLYVDGSSRGNPGPAGAGAVILADGSPLLQLGRPVGSNAGNNVAEYAALQLGLDAVVTRFDPARLEVRIDSMTVVGDVWRGESSTDAYATYSDAIGGLLAVVPDHEWTHLVDSDPNPADARATVGADIAALGP